MKISNYQQKFYLVDEGTFLSNIESGFFFGGTAFNLEKRCVFMLIPQTTLVAGEDGLGVEPGLPKRF